MPATGLPVPGSKPEQVPQLVNPGPVSVGGILPLRPLSAMLAEKRAEDEAALQEQQSQQYITGLAGLVKEHWVRAREARRPVARQMREALYARRGEYTPEKLAKIAESNQPPIYMMLFSVKCRQAESLIRDVMLGTGADKPWTIKPTPVPDLPMEEVMAISAQVQAEIADAEMAGLYVTIPQIVERLKVAKAELEQRVMEEARRRAENMERKMEDQLTEGGFHQALDEFISDLTTFKTAIIQGPIVRKKPRLTWSEDGTPVVTDELVLEWERVNPLDIYPAPWAKCINDGPLIHHRRLTREALYNMIGVEGYSEPAIRKVLEQFGDAGLNQWLFENAENAEAEGKDTLFASSGTGLIDALQYWGSVSGKMLRQWGMDAEQVPDEAKEYQAEVWVIGPYVIKAVLNHDPLARRNYYADSYERVPGSFWGNSVYDLMSDCQDMCNAAARALAANLGISSGPQVAFNVDRLPSGEDITQMYPWKVWQFTSDPMGSTAKPIEFFQPTSNAAELMAVFERFSLMADEYTGIPRYMAGLGGGEGGAGRTASGMSMMITNASKIIKQVVGSIDAHVMRPLLERLYYYNMRYSDDPDLKGDVSIVARGALSLIAKESAQVRRNEFLAATANPIDLQIVGLEGRAELLREAAKALDMNPDKIVPPVAVLKERAMMQALMAQGAPQAQPGQQQPKDPRSNSAGGKQQLEDGSPVTDNFEPASA
jgi:hypothetical protein